MSIPTLIWTKRKSGVIFVWELCINTDRFWYNLVRWLRLQLNIFWPNLTYIVKWLMGINTLFRKEVCIEPVWNYRSILFAKGLVLVTVRKWFWGERCTKWWVKDNGLTLGVLLINPCALILHLACTWPPKLPPVFQNKKKKKKHQKAVAKSYFATRKSG